VGGTVVVHDDVAAVKKACQQHTTLIWGRQKSAFCGQSAKVVNVDMDDHTVLLQLGNRSDPTGPSSWFPQSLLTSMPESSMPESKRRLLENVAATQERAWKARKFCDAELVCGATRIEVHRSTLAAASPVFAAAFSSALQEGASPTSAALPAGGVPARWRGRKTQGGVGWLAPVALCVKGVSGRDSLVPANCERGGTAVRGPPRAPWGRFWLGEDGIPCTEPAVGAMLQHIYTGTASLEGTDSEALVPDVLDLAVRFELAALAKEASERLAEGATPACVRGRFRALQRHAGHASVEPALATLCDEIRADGSNALLRAL
jgi:hypothetical protein